MIDSVSAKAGTGADLNRTKRVPLGGNSFLFQQQDRLPPYSEEAERGVLGCVILNAKECYLEAKEKIISTDVFYCLSHQIIWDSLDEKQDFITLQQRLKDKGVLENIGGINYLSQLQDCVPSSANLSYYLEIVYEKYLLRKILANCTETAARIYEHDGEVSGFIDQYEKDVLNLRNGYQSAKFVDVPTILTKIVARVQHVVDKNEPIGMTTGFPDMDNITGGFDAGLHILSGEKSAGKTSLAFNIADYRIFQRNEKVCIISLETGAVSALTRMICCRMRIDSRNLRNNPSKEELTKLSHGNTLFKKHAQKILICQDSGLTDTRIRAICRRARQAGATLFVVDYLQLIYTDNKKMEATERVGRCVYSMKDMSKELDAPVILIAGLSRAGELRNSNEADYAADTHIKLKKPEGNKREETLWRVKGIVEKGKDSGEGKFDLDFYRNFFLFQSVPKVENTDVPYTD